MPHILQRISQSLRDGAPTGLYSVCSTHPLVLKAAVLQALTDHTPLLVEATCNQVNQVGGYSGMRPADFRDFVFDLAAEHGFPLENVILGGDHLGPNPWSHLAAEEAMLPRQMPLEGGPDLAGEVEVAGPHQVADEHVHEDEVHVVVVAGEIAVRVE